MKKGQNKRKSTKKTDENIQKIGPFLKYFEKITHLGAITTPKKNLSQALSSTGFSLKKTSIQNTRKLYALISHKLEKPHFALT